MDLLGHGPDRVKRLVSPSDLVEDYEVQTESNKLKDLSFLKPFTNYYGM